MKGRFLAFGLLLACQGSIVGGGAEGTDPGPDAPAPPPLVEEGGVVVDTGSGAPRVFDGDEAHTFLRVSRDEYAAIVRAAFPELDDAVNLAGLDLPGDEPIHGRRARPSSAIEASSLEKYLDAAERIAGGLEPSLADDVRAFVGSRGSRLFRGNIDGALVDELVALHGAFVADEASEREAFDALVMRMLVSPRFLMHVEVGQDRDGDLALLSGHEVAARLARAVWGDAPDDTLRAAADAGELDTAEGVRAQAERLLSDARASAFIWRFHEEWLRIASMDRVSLGDDAPEDSETLRANMIAETQRLVERALAEGEGGFEALFNARETSVTADVAGLYDLPHGGEDVEQVELGEERSGVLGQSSFLLSTASSERRNNAIFRGIVFMEHFLCMEPPAFPNDDSIDTTAEVDRLESPQCAGCHNQFETYGRLFDGFDALGRFDGERIAAGAVLGQGGVVEGTDDLNGTYNSVAELGDALANSEQAHNCYSERWFDFLMDRHQTASDVEGTLERDTRFAAGNVRELLVDILASDSFRRRYMPIAACEESR